MAAWSWYNFLKTTMPANTVHINMDETHIPIFPGFQQGVMIRQREPRRIGRWMACATVPKKYRRGGICHCAFVADNRDIQDLLPQLLLIPRRLCTKAEFEKIEEILPPNYFAIHASSCWMQTDVLAWLADVLRRVLTPELGNQPILLSMDAAPIHIHWEPMVAFRKNGIVPLLIPAGLTPLLQPLDVAVFSPYKAKLRNLLSRRCVAKQSIRYNIADFVSVVVQASEVVLVRRDWRQTFQRCGFAGTDCPDLQSVVDIKEVLGIPSVIEPNLDQGVVDLCMPSNRWLPLVAFHPGVDSTLPMLKELFPFADKFAGCPESVWRRHLRDA